MPERGWKVRKGIVRSFLCALYYFLLEKEREREKEHVRPRVPINHSRDVY